MEFGGIVIDLGTIAGVALVTSLVVQFFVKRPLNKYKDTKDWYGIAVNGLTLVIALAVTFLGLMITNAVWDGPEIGNAILRGLMAAVAAIGGYEGVANAWGFLRKPEVAEPGPGQDGEA